MKKIKKLISLLLALVLSVGLFAACTNEITNEDPTTTNGETTDVGQEPVADVQIATNKKVHFKIIYPTDTADDVKESIFSLYEALVNRSNNGVVLISEADSKGYNADATEILIGDTGYPQLLIKNERQMDYAMYVPVGVGVKLKIADRKSVV